MRKRSPKPAAPRPVKAEREPDDPWTRFWERLIVDWVAVTVVAFGLQGLWFGFTTLWVSQAPDMKPALTGVSAKLGWPWLLAVAVGLVWGVKRALDAREAPSRRR